MALRTRRHIPEDYIPRVGVELQCVGIMNCKAGAMGRETMVLVRRRPGAKMLAVSVERLPYAASLYPLELTVSIPSPGGGRRTVTVIPADGPVLHRFSLAMPPDVEPGAALDIVFRAGRAASAPDVRLARSLFIKAIEQRP